MRNRYFILIVLLFLNAPLIAQKPKVKQERHTQPSRMEIIEWLNSKMADKPPSPINDDGTVNKIVESISSDGKIFNNDLIVYKTFTDVFSSNPKLDTRNIHSVFIADLNPESLSIRYYKKIFFISATTTNSKRKVKLMMPSNYTEEPISDYKASYETTIDIGPFDTNKESNLEQRLMKALKSLIILEGGKSETF